MRLLSKFFMLFFILTLKLSAFSQGDVSNNGFYIASLFKENGKNVVFVHKFLTKELVRKIALPTTESIDEIKLSSSGKFLYAKKNTTVYVVDILQQKIISTVYSCKQIIFFNNEEFFLVLKNSSITKYSTTTGKLVSSFSYPSGKKIYELFINSNDKLFAAKAIDRVYIYSNTKKEIQKTLSGTDIKFSKDGNNFTVLSNISDKVRVSTYNSNSFYQESALHSDLVLSNQKPLGELLANRCSLSNDGKYVAFYTAKNFKVEIFVYSTLTNKLVWIINNFVNTSNELFPHVWTKYDKLIAYGKNQMVGEYDVISKQSSPLGLRVDNIKNDENLTITNQIFDANFSSNFHYVAVQSGNDLYLRDSRIPNKKIILKNVEFISFSPDNKYVFIKKENTVNAFVTQQFTRALNTNSELKLYSFDKTLSIVVNEAEIKYDSKPPKGYAFFYVNNTKQIVKVDTAKLHYVFRSVKLNNNEVELQVNLVDENGNQFIGATDPSWKYIWCNLLIQNPNGVVTQINDFKLQEVNESSSVAYALVLDHSGSMGTRRANALEYGAWDLVNHKRQQDAFLLIKYDNNVKLLSNLTKEKYLVQKHLNNLGIQGFGGGTALVDATYLAVRKLAKATKYSKKVIILFTDGYENASISSKFELLTEAKNNGIEINVIGFGDKINEKYLKSIAYNTGGIYVHLYKTKDLRKVFLDIDYKLKNYYSIKFNTQVKGKHIAFLQLCQDFNKHDSIWIPFDNSVQNYRIDKSNPVLPLEPKKVRLTNFNKLKIPINPSMKPVKSSKINNDFSDINFPNILFKTSSDVIVNSEKQGIDEIVLFMRKYPYVFLEIHGHTDNQGSSDFNLHLSQRRALAAKNLIVKSGIAPGRIITRGYGDTKPLTTNDNEEGKAKNRRIEFYIYVQK